MIEYKKNWCDGGRSAEALTAMTSDWNCRRRCLLMLLNTGLVMIMKFQSRTAKQIVEPANKNIGTCIDISLHLAT